MHQPDISNAAQQAQEEASATDIKCAALEFDQAEPRVGPNGWTAINEEEGTKSEQKEGDVDDSAVAISIRNREGGDLGPRETLPVVPELKSRFSKLRHLLGFLIDR